MEDLQMRIMSKKKSIFLLLLHDDSINYNSYFINTFWNMERTLASTVILKRNKMLGDNTEIEQDENSKIKCKTEATYIITNTIDENNY